MKPWQKAKKALVARDEKALEDLKRQQYATLTHGIKQPEIDRLKAINAELINALVQAARALETAAQGVDDDHPMHGYFIDAERAVRAAIDKAK